MGFEFSTRPEQNDVSLMPGTRGGGGVCGGGGIAWKLDGSINDFCGDFFMDGFLTLSRHALFLLFSFRDSDPVRSQITP